MEYIKVSKAAEKWGISARRVRVLCAEGKIDGVIRKGNLYMIPATASKPVDGRLGRNGRLLEIEKKRDRLSKLRPLTQGEVERLAQEFMIEFTYNSNAIEGNTLTLKETALALEGMTIDQKPLKDHLEAVGHRDAFLYVQEIAKNEVALSEYVIKNIHALVLMNRPEDKGQYRRIPVRIMGAYTEPVQPYLIEPMMNELIFKNEARKSEMTTVELIRDGFPPINVKFTDRKRYYDAFDAFYRDGNAEKMIDLIAEYVDERLDQYLEVLEV